MNNNFQAATGLFDFRRLRGGGGGGGGGASAADLMAVLTRQQWQDYVAQFIPIENELIEYAMNPETVTKAVDQARAGVAKSFEAQQGITARRLRSNQQTLTAEEQATADRATNLSKSLADVQAANTARDMTVARQRGILAGVPTPQVTDMARGG